MLSLLNPLALWLSPLLAAPLIIHFLGRTNPKVRDFPSVLLVRGKLAQALRRQKLRNRWLLVLRTLLLLFLFLSAGDPIWRPRDAWPLPAAAGMLMHNGAYSLAPHAGGTFWDSERRLLKSLDSLTEGRARGEPYLKGGSTGGTVARFGTPREMSEAVSRLLAHMKAQTVSGSVNLFLPVFFWSDLGNLREPITRALREQGSLRLVFLEAPQAAERLSPFARFETGHPRDGILSLKARIFPAAAAAGAFEWKPSGGTAREIARQDHVLEILHPFSGAGWLNGSFASTSGEGFAFPAAAVSLRLPPPATWCHVGNGSASLASLGRAGPRQTIRNFFTGRVPEGQADGCDFLFLADPAEADDGLLALAAARARRGGKVVLSLGPNADPALFNRALLVPLGLGRLTALERDEAVILPAGYAKPTMLRPARWGKPGTVKIRVGMIPDSGAAVLLTANKSPLLIRRDVGKGAILLWTTSLDDEDWSDVGMGPWPTLVHQAFAGSDWEAGTGLRITASDSLVTLAASEEGERRIFDPGGAPFPRWQRDAGGWRAGPFDQLGLYRLETDRGKSVDTSWIAVQLAENRLRPENGSARAGFLEGLGEVKTRTAVLGFGSDWTRLYGGRRLRLWVLALAALLLLVEGVVSLSGSARQAPASRD